jgi:hypothetical protein
MLNILKVMGNCIFIYTHWAPNSKKIIKKIPFYMWPMFNHVRPCVNYEWTKIQLRMNLNLTIIELKINWKWIKN